MIGQLSPAETERAELARVGHNPIASVARWYRRLAPIAYLALGFETLRGVAWLAQHVAVTIQ